MLTQLAILGRATIWAHPEHPGALLLRGPGAVVSRIGMPDLPIYAWSMESPSFSYNMRTVSSRSPWEWRGYSLTVPQFGLILLPSLGLDILVDGSPFHYGISSEWRERRLLNRGGL